MYLVTNEKTECCGCRACSEICPRACISFIDDEEGFSYPHIDTIQCIKCHLCEKVCPIYYNNFNEEPDGCVYVGKHNSENVIFNSSSGGAFTAIYEELLKENFIVYGAKFDENLKVIHSAADNVEGCAEFRKSKYILGDTNGCFSKISKDLSTGKKILFTGTPCQCAALVSFLNIKNISKENLILIDILCHGGPNQSLFDIYLQELSWKYNSKVIDFIFRNKKEIDGKVNSRSVEVKFLNGKSVLLNTKRCAFLKGYHSRLFYRSSCSQCRFAKTQRVSDMTIADAWGVEKIYPELVSLKGVSLCLFIQSWEKVSYLISLIM